MEMLALYRVPFVEIGGPSLFILPFFHNRKISLKSRTPQDRYRRHAADGSFSERSSRYIAPSPVLKRSLTQPISQAGAPSPRDQKARFVLEREKPALARLFPEHVLESIRKRPT